MLLFYRSDVDSTDGIRTWHPRAGDMRARSIYGGNRNIETLEYRDFRW